MSSSGPHGRLHAWTVLTAVPKGEPRLDDPPGARFTYAACACGAQKKTPASSGKNPPRSVYRSRDGGRWQKSPDPCARPGSEPHGPRAAPDRATTIARCGNTLDPPRPTASDIAVAAFAASAGGAVQ